MQLCITDKEGYRAELAYDRMWNVSSIKSPDGGIQWFIYDSDNRLKEHTLPNTIIQKGRKNIRYYVKDYENSLFDLK